MITDTFISSDGKTQIYYYIYEPIETPRAVVQISHGMMDYIGRYKDLIDKLNGEGIVVCGCDDLGHGETGKNSKYGFFGIKNGKDYVLKDLHTTMEIVKEKFPNLPYFLVGHSMGSFFARYFAYKYPTELNGLILLGTSGKVKGTNFALLLLKILMLFKGKRGYCKQLEKMSSASYYRYLQNPKDARAWVTSNEKRLDNYLSDPKCSFRFTLSAYYDMISTLKFVNSKKWFNHISKDLPIILLSGAKDPVGQYGTGVAQVYSRLENKRHYDLQIKLYANAFHELHNERLCIRNEFLNDITIWLNAHIENV